MKCIVYPEIATDGKVFWSWHLETEAGTVIAKSTRTFEEVKKCERELRDVMSSAASSKLIRRKLETQDGAIERSIYASKSMLNRLRTTIKSA